MKKSRKMFSDEKELEMVERYKEGVTSEELANEFNCSLYTVRRIMKRRGVKMVRRVNGPVKRESFFTKEQEAEIVLLYEQGAITAEISKKFFCSDQTIRRTLKRNGVTLERRMVKGVNKKSVFTDEQESELVQRYERGELISDLAKYYFCHRQTVRNTLKKHGVELMGERRSGAIITKEDVREIINRYKVGVSANELGRDFGCSHSRITRILKENGISIDANRRNVKKGLQRKIPLKDIMFHYIDEPKSLDEIAKTLNSSRKTIKKNLIQHKIDLIPLKERKEIQKEYANTGKLFNRTADWSKAL